MDNFDEFLEKLSGHFPTKDHTIETIIKTDYDDGVHLFYDVDDMADDTVDFPLMSFLFLGGARTKTPPFLSTADVPPVLTMMLDEVFEAAAIARAGFEIGFLIRTGDTFSFS